MLRGARRGTRDSQRYNNTSESLASRCRFIDLIYQYDDQIIRFQIYTNAVYTNNVYVYVRGLQNRSDDTLNRCDHRLSIYKQNIIRMNYCYYIVYNNTVRY